MGIVYRAHDMLNDRDVALKIILPDETNRQTREQFLHEAHTTAQLIHPHIITVYETGAVDTGATEPVPFIVMELVRGPSLGDMRGLSFAQIIDLGQQICDALEYAHAQGLIHRDLKPENVLVEKNGYRYIAKLVDFGLARLRGESNLSDNRSVAGTVYYLAPEVIAGEPADIGADLYALGVMLYELVTGHVPFSDWDAETILSQHVQDAVIPPSHTRNAVPPALEAIILRLLAKDPRERFASARQVCEALGQIAIGAEQIAVHTNLPRHATRMIGRANEIAQVRALLEANPVVTLLGCSGIGKTRLALATGDTLFDQFADGVWLVELEPWRDPALVPQLIASVLGIREESQRALMVLLAEHLREKNLLLILDHCDHVIGACAQLIATLVRTSPQVRILATSHTALNLATETSYRVPPLTLSRPDETEPSEIARAAAVQLMTERIRARAPQFEISAAHATLLAQICRRIDGIPLAIELVAARVPGLTLDPVAAQLDQLPTAQTQEQTMRAVIEWSYHRLTVPQQTLFARLSVFIGSCTFADLEAFSGAGTLDVMSQLTQLAHHALVKTSPTNGGELRYHLPEPIREFALAQLRASGTEEITRRNYRNGYLNLAHQAQLHLHRVDQGIWRQRLEAEYANLLAALDWTMERPQEANLAIRFGGALWQFWDGRGYRKDGYARLTKILALPHTLADAPARVDVMIGAGYLAIVQTDYAAAAEWLTASLDIARAQDNQLAIAYALCGLGALAQARRDYAQAALRYHDGWGYFQATGDSWETANALLNLGLVNLKQGKLWDARTHLLTSLNLYRQFGDRRKTAHVQSFLGAIEYARKQYAEAQAYFMASLALWRKLADPFEIAQQLDHLGYVALHENQLTQAHQFFNESLALFKDLNRRRAIADGLYGIAGVIAQRQPERAAQLIGAANALLQAPGTPVETTRQVETDQAWILARITLNAEIFQAAYAQGQTWSLDHAIAVARENA